ncbi:MAG: helix-turn-helix transcriptional regulator [Lachnospiraceae bacterium]|nr:helix-turn-helix transcriptional regulator [Lachnospiraceae bacterium]
MEHVFPMIDLKATGRRIKELREQRGISVRQLQAFLGFEQPQAIYKWQRGECLPTFDNMYAMACFFHVKVDEILVGNRQDFDIKEKILFYFELMRQGAGDFINRTLMIETANDIISVINRKLFFWNYVPMKSRFLDMYGGII